jgi:hypothetical protein
MIPGVPAPEHPEHPEHPGAIGPYSSEVQQPRVLANPDDLGPLGVGQPERPEQLARGEELGVERVLLGDGLRPLVRAEPGPGLPVDLFLATYG